MVTYYNTIQFCMNDLKKKKERWKNSRNIFKTLLCAPKSFSYSRCSIIVIQEKIRMLLRLNCEWPRTTDAQWSFLFIKRPNCRAWADNLGRSILGHLGYFRLIYQHPFWYSESLVRVFPLFNHYFNQKLSLYIHIPNIYWGLGFEFGPQRIRDLAFVCPQSVS